MGHQGQHVPQAVRWAQKAREVEAFTSEYIEYLQAQLVKHALHATGASQRELAEDLGTSKSRINRLARASSEPPHAAETEDVAAALETIFLGTRVTEVREGAAAYDQASSVAAGTVTR
ncbi:hypothetical protein HP467_15870 [Curtobacterium albidum]|uniref:Uncharacterized protein n=1 Tax=Curtobacterium citreum TaxID=2036 RepID=A0A850DXQ0_9MICO|nr:hypothetical protein [Curtobacterium albidum]NUU29569.1 hypothetical protein [Curtobacterium albidum]